MTNSFFEKLYAKYGGETSPSLFPKISKLNISLGQKANILYSYFSLYAQVEGYWKLLKQSCWQLAFTS